MRLIAVDWALLFGPPTITRGRLKAEILSGVKEEADLYSRHGRVARAFQAYKDDTVRLMSRNLSGATHVVASRKGLYSVNDREWNLLVDGFFFGLAIRGRDIFAFECCDLPSGPLKQGRIIKLECQEDAVVHATVLAKGLDNGCHQIDFIDNRLHVIDTYNQQILRFEAGEQHWETETPLPKPSRRCASDDPLYFHMNSLLRVGDVNLLLLHNTPEQTQRRSEVAVFNHDWKLVERWALKGRGCHGLALLEDGTLLTCGSMAGELISAQGLRVPVSASMTRGLSVGSDSVVVGASMLASREDRIATSGTLTFMDRDYRIQSVMEVPGAPTEIRRLDGKDYGLSNYLREVPWGTMMQTGPIARP